MFTTSQQNFHQSSFVKGGNLNSDRRIVVVFFCLVWKTQGGPLLNFKFAHLLLIYISQHAVRMSPLEVHYGIRKQHGLGVIDKHTNFSNYLCHTIQRCVVVLTSFFTCGIMFSGCPVSIQSSEPFFKLCTNVHSDSKIN